MEQSCQTQREGTKHLCPVHLELPCITKGSSWFAHKLISIRNAFNDLFVICISVNLQNLLILKKKDESKEITAIKYKHLYAAVSLADYAG